MSVGPRARTTATRLQAEDMRQQLGKLRVPHALGTISLTASFGVAGTLGGSGDSPQKLLVRADNLLYRAKRGGRNQVAGGESPPTRG